MRAMEERANVALVMARNAEERDRCQSAQVCEERSQISKSHPQVIRKLLVEGCW